MDSVCTWGVVEMTMKLVNPIILVTAYIVIATNMRWKNFFAADRFTIAA